MLDLLINRQPKPGVFFAKAPAYYQQQLNGVGRWSIDLSHSGSGKGHSHGEVDVNGQRTGTISNSKPTVSIVNGNPARGKSRNL